MLTILSRAMADIVAWALVDSLWQAALIAAALRAFQVALPLMPARLRSATALAGLLGTVLTFGVSILGPQAVGVAPFPFAPWIVAGWLVSTTVLMIRLVGGWWLLHQGEVCITHHWDNHLARLRERFAIERPVTIGVSSARHIAVFGHRRPVIIVPVMHYRRWNRRRSTRYWRMNWPTFDATITRSISSRPSSTPYCSTTRPRGC